MSLTFSPEFVAYHPLLPSFRNQDLPKRQSALIHVLCAVTHGGTRNLLI